MRKRTKIILFLMDHLIWVMLGLFIIIMGISCSGFLRYMNIINILSHSTILGLLILAQGLALSSGNFDLSIESTLAFAPAIAILITTRWLPGLPVVMAILLVFAIGALIGVFNGICVSRIGINPFLQTLSMLIVLRGIVMYFLPLSIYNLPKPFTFLGAKTFWGNIPLSVLVLIAVYILMHFIINRARFGRHLIATGGNSKASFISGIKIKGIVLKTFVISGILASLAGFIAAGRMSACTNSMGENMALLSFAGAVLGGVSLKGGIGQPIGMLGGALFIGAVDNALNLLGIDVYLVYAFKGLLIFFAVLLDQYKTNTRAKLLHKENLRKLKKEGEIAI